MDGLASDRFATSEDDSGYVTIGITSTSAASPRGGRLRLPHEDSSETIAIGSPRISPLSPGKRIKTKKHPSSK